MTTIPQQSAAGPLRLRASFRLQWEASQNTHVLLYPEGMVKLNTSAAEILKRCDGTHDMASLVAELEQAFATTGLAAEIHAFLAQARVRGWLA